MPHKSGNFRPLADRVTSAVRSRMMAGIRAADTRPEMLVRRGLHALGWRYRLHVKNLPGKPDMVFPRRAAVIMIHGCFWHGHDCHLFRWPATRPEFWREKIGSNVRRDLTVRDELARAGWRQCEVWECALKGRTRIPFEDLLSRCVGFLEGSDAFASIMSDKRVRIPPPEPVTDQ